MLPRVKYLEARQMLAQQKEVRSCPLHLALSSSSSSLTQSLSPRAQVILAKIRLLSQSHVVHPGLTFFASRPGTKIDPAKVPGLRESGWTPEMDELCVARPLSLSLALSLARSG